MRENAIFLAIPRISLLTAIVAIVHVLIQRTGAYAINLNDVHAIMQSVGPWQANMPEWFVQNQMLPFIRQFRRQLNPRSQIMWAGNNNFLRRNLNQGGRAIFSHVDLNPPEQMAFRPVANGWANSMSDLGGMIVRQMWRKVKTHCVRCVSRQQRNNRMECTLVHPQCGFPYQLFFDQAQQIYCAVTLAKANGIKQLRARMQCATNPMTPTLAGNMLARNFQRNLQYMCINCTINGGGSVGCPGGGNFANFNDCIINNNGSGNNHEYWDNASLNWDYGYTGRNAYNNNGGIIGGMNGGNGMLVMPTNNFYDNNKNIGGMIPTFGNDFYDYDGIVDYGTGTIGWNNNNNNNINWNANWNGNGGQRTRGNVLRIPTNQKFSRIYQINTDEGQHIARYINRVRAQIARGEAPNLPVAAGMNQVKWKNSLASEAMKQLQSRDNELVNIIDLEFTNLLPATQRQQQQRQQQQWGGNNAAGWGTGNGMSRRQYALISGRGTNYVDLDARNLLLWTVRNYLEMFTNQQGLRCENDSCKATCLKGTHRTRAQPWQRTAQNPADYHCYPYELLYDRAHSIGCAVRFETRQKTHLQAKMVCVMEHQVERHGNVRRMMHKHNVYKIGAACSHCEHSHFCDNRTKLCVSRRAQQHGYEPIGRLPLNNYGVWPNGNANNGIVGGTNQNSNTGYYPYNNNAYNQAGFGFAGSNAIMMQQQQQFNNGNGF